MIRSIFFDVFGTIVDWRSGISHALQNAFSKSGADLKASDVAKSWNRKVAALLQERIRSMGDYAAIDELYRVALDDTLDEAGLTRFIGDREYDHLSRAWERLPPWPDSVPGLRALRRDYVLASCTAAPVAMTTWLAKYANLPFDLVLGADIARTYPPAPRFYHASASLIGLAPHEVIYASAHHNDLAAAREAGLRTAYFPRPKEHEDRQVNDTGTPHTWDIEAYDILDLARQMESRAF